MKRLIKYILFLLLLTIDSCSREHWMNPPVAEEIGQKSVMLKLAVPSAGTQGTTTRSIGSYQENTIETLDILAFKVENGVETFQYWAEGKKDVGHDEGESLQSFTATLRMQDYPQRFVLITNAHQKVMELISKVDWRHVEKEVMLSNLTFSLMDQGGGDRWKATGALSYTAIPMWGETAPKVISATTTSISDSTIPMLRMVAKMEVQLDESVTNLTNTFKLKSVHVYNTNTSGRITPKPGITYIDNMIAQKASLPTSVTSVVGPLAYTDFTPPGDIDKAMRGAIYLFETAAKNNGDFLEQTCIVVGGYYGADHTESYYRLDFYKSNGTDHLDILRNHRYICNIIEVKGRGLPTVDEAYRTKSFNMVANILAWNEGAVPNMMIEGQYMLGVSQDRIELDGDAYGTSDLDNIVTIITNHPDGWKASIWANKAGTIPSFWLSANPSSGIGNAQHHQVHVVMGKNPGSERTAYIHIKAGRMTYVVTVVQGEALDGIITVSPDYISLPYIMPSNGAFSVQVTATKSNGAPDPNAGWTLTSANAWLRLSPSSTASYTTASGVVSGTGNQTVYLYAPDNLDMNSRRTTIYLGASSSDVVVDVIQYGNPGSITDNEGAGTPVNNRTYVGAFWRANETGERLIRIDASDNMGTWSATVMWKDARWGFDDGILIDTNQLSGPELLARGISFTGDMNPDVYGTPEDTPVTGVMATGNVTASNKYIFFRIGLKTTYTPTTDHPARYAVVLLSYANQTKHQKIFLRQGENPDYLMMNGDELHPLSDLKSPRTKSQKFAVYNLTADTFGATIAPRSAKFAQYPSQAGALWQWGVPADQTYYLRRPHDPSTVPSMLYGYNAPGYWNTLEASNEVIPIGFRRVNDGLINGSEDASATSIANSEMRQSLFWKVRSGWNYGVELGNSIWGYYADGYFDRRKLSNGTGITATNTTVASGTPNIAHIGRLFYNPLVESDRLNASLFFPAAGWLNQQSNGTIHLMNTGTDGNYWSSSARLYNGQYLGLGLIIRDYQAQMWQENKHSAVSIRPVAE